MDGATMSFCSECSNLLYPHADPAAKKLLWRCRACGHSEESDRHLVFRNDIKRTQKLSQLQIKQLVLFAQDPTVGRWKTHCKKCESRDVASFINPLQQPHEDMSMFFACASCKFVWKSGQQLAGDDDEA